jgi:hypothetical protein
MQSPVIALCSSDLWVKISPLGEGRGEGNGHGGSDLHSLGWR